jgi:hypothetical protein
VQTVEKLGEVPVVEAYPLLWESQGASQAELGAKRSFEGASMWKLHVGARGKS